MIYIGCESISMSIDNTVVNTYKFCMICSTRDNPISVAKTAGRI
jgi:hypothetical protein